MMIKYIKNDEDSLIKKFNFANEDTVKMGNKLISTHHTHIRDANICLLMRAGSWKEKGSTIYGRAYKVGDKEKLLNGYDFIIVLNEDVWHRLKNDKKNALLDHELCHCDADENDEGNPIWKLVKHDVEEFSAVVRRHGLYREDLEQFVDCAHQMNVVSFEKSAG